MERAESPALRGRPCTKQPDRRRREVVRARQATTASFLTWVPMAGTPSTKISSGYSEGPGAIKAMERAGKGAESAGRGQKTIGLDALAAPHVRPRPPAACFSTKKEVYQ